MLIYWLFKVACKRDEISSVILEIDYETIDYIYIASAKMVLIFKQRRHIKNLMKQTLQNKL